MKYFELDEEEKEIEEAFEKGQLKPIKNLAAEKNRLQKAAAYTLAKTKNINIRLSQKVLLKLKAKAAEMGLPYQTLASSILHQAVIK
ncbi:hypothetical protein A2721_01720 [Candidatus Gottesmanbacteria bacterium RIFCSPHIGHO2_01_FULL_47_48]|uniref:Antitoxin n=1 Tax=Candidatus Gottesmanbacteria bacterium RIFCSPHIGHO2_01_FULL_47_48 TaxID=1798381 RepID=A0A1F6A1E1_9BACT|nr:MAG: hypothetical protein A2721_01720 [Candidatus Gottesmanbacteria bacterium RIFCSPHIGHO2_01_FULL_47_48]